MGAPLLKGRAMNAFQKIRKIMERNAKKIIALMMLFILLGAFANMGLSSTERKARFDALMSAYEFITSEKEGIGLWNTEEKWKEGMNQLIALCPKEGFQTNVLYGDNEMLRQMLRNVRRVKFSDKNRAEVAELVMKLRITDASHMGMYKIKVDHKDVKEINYLTGIRMVY